VVEIAADGLKGLFQQVESRHESLIGGQAGEERSPILLDEPMHRFFLELAVQVREPVDSDQLLIGKPWLGVIAQALKTGFRAGIVNVADKQIELNQLIFHGKKILPIRPACLSFQLLIHIIVGSRLDSLMLSVFSG
jgi:hypothetical protein